MHKSCIGCKALSEIGQGSCMLGFIIEYKRRNVCWGYTDWIPKEQCPKPMTFKEFYADKQVYKYPKKDSD